MLNGVCTRTHYLLAIGLLVLLASCSSSPVPSATAVPPSVSNAPAKFLGPLLSSQETATQSLGRDGGITVPLPNGKVLWIFGDTPTYKFEGGKWNLRGFIQGSSAGIGAYTPGQSPKAPFDELAVGQPATKATQAAQFLPPPQVYLPDGSGRVCTKDNGGQQAGQVRWASGAVLMPDKTNIFVPYIDACVLSATNHQSEGWGFAMYNWKTNKFTVPPVDVFAPKKSGEKISTAQYFGSPILKGKKITMYSWVCCDTGSAIYSTTVDAKVSALKNPSSYSPRPILGLPATFWLTVSQPQRSLPKLTMYQLSGDKGAYRILTATNPEGPWLTTAIGALPRCDTSPAPCNNSIYIHPQFSNSHELVVSYWLPGYGPGIPTNPDPSQQIWHNVLASIPI
jgi:hypothetical protein